MVLAVRGITTSTEGGALQDWFRVITDEDYTFSRMSSENYEQTRTVPLSVKN